MVEPTSQEVPRPPGSCDVCCKRKLCICVTAALLLAVGIAGITVTCFVLEQNALQYQHHYGVIFDAGSTHTDVSIYRWPSDYRDHGTAHIEQMLFERCADKGIASFERTPEDAGNVIQKCVEDFVLTHLPPKDVKKTAIYLGATAGMRLLCKRNREACEKILGAVRRSLNGFKFRLTQRRVRVLTGKEEATFGWVTSNILTGALNGSVAPEKNSDLVGALDMGGGSAEISFMPAAGTKMPANATSYTTLYGQTYALYTHSYLCYGFRESERRMMANLVEASNFSRMVVHPCYQQGFNKTVKGSAVWMAPCSKKPGSAIFPLKNDSTYVFVGGGSPEMCESEIKKLFNVSAPCKYDTCSFNGVYQPPLKGSFLAYAGYGYIATFLNVTTGVPLRELKTRGEKLCNKTWAQFKTQNPHIKPEYLREYCFEALYSYQMLTYGLQFRPNSDVVHFVKDVNGLEVGWSLGFMVNATNSIPAEAHTYRITQQEFFALLIACGLIGMVGLALLTVFCVRRRLERSIKYKYSLIQ